MIEGVHQPDENIEEYKRLFHEELDNAIAVLRGCGIDDLSDRELIFLRQVLQRNIDSYRRDVNDRDAAANQGDVKKAKLIEYNRISLPGGAAALDWLDEYLGINPEALNEMAPILQIDVNNVPRRFEKDEQSQAEARRYVNEMSNRYGHVVIRRYDFWDDPKIIKYIRLTHDRILSESETSGIS